MNTFHGNIFLIINLCKNSCLILIQKIFEIKRVQLIGNTVFTMELLSDGTTITKLMVFQTIFLSFHCNIFAFERLELFR